MLFKPLILVALNLLRTPLRAISEPWSLLYAQGHHADGDISDDEYKRMVRSIVRLQCKPEHDREEGGVAFLSVYHNFDSVALTQSCHSKLTQFTTVIEKDLDNFLHKLLSSLVQIRHR